MPTTASSSARSRSRLVTTSPTRSSISCSSSSSRTRDSGLSPSDGARLLAGGIGGAAIGDRIPAVVLAPSAQVGRRDRGGVDHLLGRQPRGVRRAGVLRVGDAQPQHQVRVAEPGQHPAQRLPGAGDLDHAAERHHRDAEPGGGQPGGGERLAGAQPALRLVLVAVEQRVRSPPGRGRGRSAACRRGRSRGPARSSAAARPAAPPRAARCRRARRGWSSTPARRGTPGRWPRPRRRARRRRRGHRPGRRSSSCSRAASATAAR